MAQEQPSVIEELASLIGEDEDKSEDLAEAEYDDESDKSSDVREEVKEVADDSKGTDEETEEKAEAVEEGKGEEEEPSELKKSTLPETIPYVRFKEVNDQKKEAQDQVAALRGEIGQLRNQMIEFLGKKEVPKKEAPDPNTDPDGYIKWANETIEQTRQELTQLKAGQTQDQGHLDRIKKIGDYTIRKQQAFAQEHPDYYVAVQYLQNSIIQERLDKGDSYAGAMEYYNQIAGNELERFYRTEGDPAKFIYNVARDRGYKPPSAQNESEEKKVEAKPKAKPIDKKKVEKANRTVANAGKAAETNLEEVDVDSMTPAQFQKFLAQQKRAAGKEDFRLNP